MSNLHKEVVLDLMSKVVLRLAFTAETMLGVDGDSAAASVKVFASLSDISASYRNVREHNET